MILFQHQNFPDLRYSPEFHTLHMVQVTFVGEGAIDQGGPKREFFRILAEQASLLYFRGDDVKFMRNNMLAVQVLDI